MTDEGWLEAQGFQEVAYVEGQWRKWCTKEVHLYLNASKPLWLAYVADEVLDSLGPAGHGLATEGTTPAEAVALLRVYVQRYREDARKRVDVLDEYYGRLATKLGS